MKDPVVIKIKRNFDIEGNPARIPLMNGKKTFIARLEEDGISVDNLGNQPFLPWKVFSEAVNCLKENGGQVKKGNAMGSRLGDSDLDLNTMEGYVASKVYGCKVGDSVFRRITPVVSILAWAEICENARGQVRLLKGLEEFSDFANEEEVPPVQSTDGIIESSEITSHEITSHEITGHEIASPEIMSHEIKSPEISPVSMTTEREQEVLQNNDEIKELQYCLSQREGSIKSLQEKLETQLSEIERYKSELTKRIEEIGTLEGKLAKKEEDLQILAEKVLTVDSEIRKVEETLAGREKKINNLEVALATGETKVKNLEKQLSGYKVDENLAIQIREKEELIRQLKGTLASKEEEFSRLTEENRKYKRQQKFESEGLKQIEEQKSSKKWWKNW